MSDKEKVAWMRVLLWLWGCAAVPLFMMALHAPVAVDDGPRAISIVLILWSMFTVVYLLILSWRAAYLSGRGSR